MLRNRLMTSLIAGSVLVAGAAGAQAKDRKKDDQPLPQVFADVLECRKLTDPDARLACFDTKVAALETANDTKSVVVMSEESITETRRGLFGFSLPRLGIFRDSEADEGLKEITATIMSVRGGDGAWIFTLEDGAQWQQTDGVFLKKPKTGQSITIRRAALGSFMGKVEGGLGFRVKRIN